MSEHIVDHALAFYTDTSGVQHIGMRGQKVELTSAEAKRLTDIGAVVASDADVPVTAPVVEPLAPVAPEDAGKLLQPVKPARAAAKPADSK